MKKLLSIILALSFVLCAASLFTVSAAETHLSGSGKGWKTTRGGGVFYTDADREIYWKAGGDGKTWAWPVVHSGSLTNGVITATMSASGNVGIFFGGDGIATNVKDGGTSSLLGATDVRYSWVAIEVNPSTGEAKLAYFYDDETAAGTDITDYRKSWLPLNDTPENAAKFGIDGSSDIELKVSFNEKGKMKAYVNGALVTSREGSCVPFGGEYGIITCNASYGSEKANSEVGYIKSFSATDKLSGLDEEWIIRRGGASWAASAGNEFDVLFVNNNNKAQTFNNLAQYYKNLEEGTVTATVGAGSRIGIAFAGTGFENVFEGSGGALTQVENLMYYQAVLDYDGSVAKLYIALKVDSCATSDVASNTPTEIKKVYLSSNSLINNDYTLKVTFTKAGDIKIYFNGEEYISVTGQTIYGSDLGMVTTARGPLDVSKVGTAAATVKNFVIEGEAPDTGDLTSVYLIASAVILSAAYAVACFSRKRITE